MPCPSCIRLLQSSSLGLEVSTVISAGAAKVLAKVAEHKHVLSEFVEANCVSVTVTNRNSESSKMSCCLGKQCCVGQKQQQHSNCCLCLCNSV